MLRVHNGEQFCLFQLTWSPATIRRSVLRLASHVRLAPWCCQRQNADARVRGIMSSTRKSFRAPLGPLGSWAIKPLFTRATRPEAHVRALPSGQHGASQRAIELPRNGISASDISDSRTTDVWVSSHQLFVRTIAPVVVTMFRSTVSIACIMQSRAYGDKSLSTIQLRYSVQTASLPQYLEVSPVIRGSGVQTISDNWPYHKPHVRLHPRSWLPLQTKHRTNVLNFGYYAGN